MTAEDVRQRLIEEELEGWRQRHKGRALAALGCFVLVAVMAVLLVVPPPEDWARGSFFLPGGWGHDQLGFDAAVALVRGCFALVGLALLAYSILCAWRLGAGNLARRREHIVATQPRLRRAAELR